MPDNRFLQKKFSSVTMIMLIIVIVILDQITKYIIKSTMYLGQSFEVLGDFFRITFVENPGMAFGVRISNSTVFLLLSLFAAILVFYYLFRLRKENWLLQLALVFIASGAIGNLADRFLYGKVVDFFDFDFFDIHIPSFTILGIQFSGYDLTRWYVFNVADMAVTCGLTVIIFYLLFIGDPLKNTQKSSLESSNG